VSFHTRDLSLIHVVCFILLDSLLERGYSLDEIAEGTIQGDKARSERYSSIAAQNWDKVNALSERFGRVLRKALPTVGGLKKHTTAATTA
jgi:hypothetical protein